VETGKSPEDSLVGEGTSLNKSKKRYKKAQESTKKKIKNLAFSGLRLAVNAFRMFPGVNSKLNANFLNLCHNDSLVLLPFVLCPLAFSLCLRRLAMWNIIYKNI